MGLEEGSGLSAQSPVMTGPVEIATFRCVLPSPSWHLRLFLSDPVDKIIPVEYYG